MRPDADAIETVSRRIVLTSPRASEATGVRGLFVPARGRVMSVSLTDLPDGTKLVEQAFNNAGFDLRWEPPLKPETKVTLYVESVGDPVRVFVEAWLPSDDFTSAADSDMLPISEIKKELVTADSIGGIGDLAARLNRRVRDAISRMPAAVRAHARFFRAYDYQTNPEIFQDSDIFEPVAGLTSDSPALRLRNLSIGPTLRRRAQKRGQWRFDGHRGPAEGLRAVDSTKLAYFSKLQLDIFKTHFGNTLDVDDFGKAFERFMNGELRVPDDPVSWNGEPNSADAYLFAEFAFAAVENSIDAAAWKALAKPLVAVQLIFNRAYMPDPYLQVPAGSGFSYGHYDPSNFKRSQQVNSRDKTALRREYAGKSFNDLLVAAGENALAAFRGDYH